MHVSWLFERPWGSPTGHVHIFIYLFKGIYLFYHLFIYLYFGHNQVSGLPLVGWPTSSLSTTTWSSPGHSITSSLPLHGRSRGQNAIMTLTPQTVGRPTGTSIKHTQTGPITPALQCHPHSNTLSMYLLTNRQYRVIFFFNFICKEQNLLQFIQLTILVRLLDFL